MPEVDIKVKLVEWTPEPEKIIESAARLCYAQTDDDIWKKDEKGNFIKLLRKMGHMSPFEHVSFTFVVEGISRACSHQLIRHRLASYSQRSQRYVKEDCFNYVIPPQIKQCKKVVNGLTAREIYINFMENTAKVYNILNDLLGNTGEKSNEDARYVLPNACETKMFVTMNARQLIHFLEERLCSRAQWEIRSMADKMLELVKKKAPNIFDAVGPKCIKLGKCPEGKMSCGNLNEKIKKYTI